MQYKLFSSNDKYLPLEPKEVVTPERLFESTNIIDELPLRPLSTINGPELALTAELINQQIQQRYKSSHADAAKYLKKVSYTVILISDDQKSFHKKITYRLIISHH